MTKKLNDILKGVKSSKIVTPDLKNIYSWAGGKSGEDFIKKHKIEKHEDRVGSDEVYKGKTNPAKYPRQSDSVYEESDCSCSKNETSCNIHGKKKKMLLDKDMKEAVTPRNRESNPFSTTTGSNTAKETTPKSETATTPKKSLKEIFDINEVAPPNPKIEKWIKSNKDNFIKEYGRKKGMEVLYAKAWKMHNEQSGSPATNTDYAGPGAAGWTTGRMDTGTL